jgi:hypothetical protein
MGEDRALVYKVDATRRQANEDRVELPIALVDPADCAPGDSRAQWQGDDRPWARVENPS